MISLNEKIVSTTCADGIEKIPGITTCEPGNFRSLSEAMAKALSVDSSNQREKFDSYLNTRSINYFVKTVFAI